MKRLYPALTALLLTAATQAATAQAMAWRPFRPGLIYTYGSVAAPATNRHTLRVDSSYATTAGDSVYVFNRLMRQTNTGSFGGYYRSRNNLFGARLRWQPGSSEYYLEADAETVGTIVATPTATILQLRPTAAVGSTWAASTQPALTATLTSRSFSTSLADTVAVISLSNGQQVRLGRRSGLLHGPQWLTFSASASAWEAAAGPQTLEQSPYSPLKLFSVEPGDELGYVWEQYNSSAFPCMGGTILRRITGRQQTADSLIISYLEQERTAYFGGPTCGGTPGSSTGPVQNQRWAFSLRTGKSPQFPNLGLLAGEYVATGNVGFPTLGMAMGLASNSSSGCALGGQLVFQRVYGQLPAQFYSPGLDALAWWQAFAEQSTTMPWTTGLGDLQTGQTHLTYYRRTLAGVVRTCGSAADFANLLATRAAQATAVATLAPNPAAGQAVLTFARPATQPATLTLADALGRRVWQGTVAAGQAVVTVPLAGQPAGLYLVQWQTGNAAPLTWKLTHE